VGDELFLAFHEEGKDSAKQQAGGADGYESCGEESDDIGCKCGLGWQHVEVVRDPDEDEWRNAECASAGGCQQEEGLRGGVLSACQLGSKPGSQRETNCGGFATTSSIPSTVAMFRDSLNAKTAATVEMPIATTQVSRNPRLPIKTNAVAKAPHAAPIVLTA
jgi:hypothetical protein